MFPLDREFVWRIPARQDQQERLYLDAVRHRQTINSGTDIFGDYLLGANNCGSWAQFMIQSHGLPFPAQARFCNLLGVGVGGPMDRPASAATEGVKRGYAHGAAGKDSAEGLVGRTQRQGPRGVGGDRAPGARVGAMVQRLRRVIAVLLGLVVLTVAACGGGKLQRTDLTRWKTKTFEEPGIVIQFPKKADVYDFGHAVLIQMHGIPPRFGVFADTRYFLEVSVRRKSEAEFERDLEETRKYVPRTAENEFQFCSVERHEAVDERDDPPYSYYRYDVPCGGGEMLSASAEIFHVMENGKPVHRAGDDAAVRRILSSIRCMEVQ